MTSSPEAARLPRLHIVTDDAVLRDPAFDATVEALLVAGRSSVALHLRGPGTSGREMWRHAERCSAIAREVGAPLIVNDRIDVAVACGASGVQLGRRSLDVTDARALLGDGRSIGVSVHDPASAARAKENGADFLVAGTLYRSRSHPDRPGSGPGWLSRLGRETPVIGIGGIVPDRVPEILEAGAHGVAVIGAVWSSSSPVDAMLAFLDRLE